MKSLPRLMMSALALSAATLAAPAHAVGRLVDVDVIDRDTGAQLPVYQHRGEWWIAGRPGARYAIQVRNAAPGRVLGVMAVDGVNVISGDTASWEQTGYVLSRGQSAQITGWRKSDAEVAAFHFTALPNSYAARTGRPDDVGVIGVAVFRERYVPPPPPVSAAPWPSRREGKFQGEPSAATAESAAPRPRTRRRTRPAPGHRPRRARNLVRQQHQLRAAQQPAGRGHHHPLRQPPEPDRRRHHRQPGAAAGAAAVSGIGALHAGPAGVALIGRRAPGG